MNVPVKRVMAIVLLALGVLVALNPVEQKPAHAPPPVAPNLPVPPPPSPPPQTSAPALMEFSTDGANAALARVNASVSGAGNVVIAQRSVGDAREVVVLTAGMEKYADFDQGWQLSDFPDLAATGFQ